MQALEGDFRALGAELVAVSSSGVESHASLARRIGAGFPILSDPEGQAIRAYGLLHPGALPFTDVPVARPAVFVLDPEGVVRARHLTENWRVRERGERLLAELRRLGAGGRREPGR
ncbi:MAG: peroxiredoxin family protein [Planctomycetes bacterium]|nr:peroxiredoxin family protein [Planctomycetota bacterium]